MRIALAALVLIAACGRGMREYGSTEPAPDERRALTPRDLTRSNTAYDEVFGADSVYHPRVFHLTANTIGISLRQAAHVAVLVRGGRCAVAQVPGHELSRRLPEGFHYLRLEAPQPTRCTMNWWTPALTVIAAELPLHGQVLEERSREAREPEELMARRTDRWAMYAVFRSRDGR